MKFKGAIRFEQTDGRKNREGRQLRPYDYFLSLAIDEIDGVKQSSRDAAISYIRSKAPQILASQTDKLGSSIDPVDLTGALKPQQIPGVDIKALHVTLGNFPDFCLNRDPNQISFNLEAIKKAKALNETPVSFEISDAQLFTLLTTSPHFDKLTMGAMAVLKKPFLGHAQDMVLNLQPADQSVFQTLSEQVFGKGFELWNAKQESVPFHVTLAVASLNEQLHMLYAEPAKEAELAVAPSM